MSATLAHATQAASIEGARAGSPEALAAFCRDHGATLHFWGGS